MASLWAAGMALILPYRRATPTAILQGHHGAQRVGQPGPPEAPAGGLGSAAAGPPPKMNRRPVCRAPRQSSGFHHVSSPRTAAAATTPAACRPGAAGATTLAQAAASRTPAVPSARAGGEPTAPPVPAP
jgi:hypothetical protein